MASMDQDREIQVLQADGGRVIFSRDPDNPSQCSTNLPANGVMSVARRSDGEVQCTWTWVNGRCLLFNGAGKLERITAPTGESVTLNYDSVNILVKVTDPQGRSLHLVYLDKDLAKAGARFSGVQYIDSPVGRFAYEYGSAVPKGAVPFDHRILLANLVRVHLPTGYEPDKPA